MLGYTKCFSPFDLSSYPWGSRADAVSSIKQGNWGSTKWSPFLMPVWPVSVPSVTSRPVPFLPHQAASHLHTRILSMYPVALLLFVVLLLQKAWSLQSKLEGPGPEAADSPKKGREPHNDRPMRRASGHQPRGVYASCGKTYSSASSFPQSIMENSTTFIYQQRQEFRRLFHLVLQAFPVTFSSRCKASCLCCLCYSDFFLVSHSASLLGHSLFRRVLYASVFFILKLDTWFPSFLLSFFLLSPNSFHPYRSSP